MNKQTVKDPSDTEHLNSLPSWATGRVRQYMKERKNKNDEIFYATTCSWQTRWFGHADMRIDDKKNT